MHHSRAAGARASQPSRPDAATPAADQAHQRGLAAPRPRRGRRRSWPGLNRLVVAGGCVRCRAGAGGAFPPFGFWPLASAGPALLILAVWGKRRLTTFTLALDLRPGVLRRAAVLAGQRRLVRLADAGPARGVIFAVLGLALRPLLRLRIWPLAVAGWWVAQEAVHDRFPWGGFPWGRLAMSQPDAPTAGWAAIGGPPLLTFLLALAGACLAYLVLALTAPACPRAAPARSGAWSLAAAVAVRAGRWPATWPGLRRPGRRRPPRSRPCRATCRTRGTCPNLLRASTVTENHALATIALARQVQAGRRPAPGARDLAGELHRHRPEAVTADVRQRSRPPSTAIGRPVLVGAVLDHPLRNAGQLWLPGRGPVQAYVKRQLVPFGEVIPLRGLLDMVTSLPSLQPPQLHARAPRRGLPRRQDQARRRDLLRGRVRQPGPVRGAGRGEPADRPDQRRGLRA